MAIRCNAMPMLGLIALTALMGAGTSAVGQTLPKWTPVQDLVIDGVREDLVPISSFLVDSRGRIYVGQRQDMIVRTFGPDGVALHSVGGRGQGPGEYRSLASIGLIGESLWVFDSCQPYRITVFDSVGRVARTHTIPSWNTKDAKRLGVETFGMRLLSGCENRSVMGVYPDSTLLLHHRFNVDEQGAATGRFVASGAPFMDQVTGRRRAAVLLARTDGRLSRVAAMLPPPMLEPREVLRRALRPDGTRVSFSVESFPQRFFQVPPFGVSQDGQFLIAADAILTGPEKGNAMVTVLRPNGDTVYTARAPVSMMPIPPDTIQHYLDRALDGEFRADVIVGFLRAPRPEFYPPLRGAMVARDGAALLVFQTDTTHRDYLAFDVRGRPEASFRLPIEVNVKRFEGRSLWATVRNADDVESVVRFTLQPTPTIPSGR